MSYEKIGFTNELLHHVFENVLVRENMLFDNNLKNCTNKNILSNKLSKARYFWSLPKKYENQTCYIEIVAN